MEHDFKTILIQILNEQLMNSLNEQFTEFTKKSIVMHFYYYERYIQNSKASLRTSY